MLNIKVVLMGAGPGDSSLLTIKARDILMRADIVLYDHLVSQSVLSYVPKKSKLIYVGKSSKGTSFTQPQINNIFIKECRTLTKKKSTLPGIIVRLKGGDPFVFGRAGEEIEVLTQNGYDFDIVPGISSYHAGMIYGGFPFTDRDVASSFSVMTGHYKKSTNTTPPLTSTSDTSIYMMGLENIEKICLENIRMGKPKNTPIAIIENASLPEQRTFTSDLNSASSLCKKENIVSPVIIVIGKVVALQNKYSWFEKKPLKNKHIYITQTREDRSPLEELLIQEGAKVSYLPFFKYLSYNKNDASNLKLLKKTSIILFKSHHAVEYFFHFLKNQKLDTRALSHTKIVAVGKATNTLLEAYQLIPDIFIPNQKALKLSSFSKGKGKIQITIPCEKEYSLEPLLSALPNTHISPLSCYAISEAKIVKPFEKDEILTLFSPLGASYYLKNIHLFEEANVVCFGQGAHNVLKSGLIKPSAVSKNQNPLEMLQTLIKTQIK